MRTPYMKAGLFLLAVFACLFLDWFQTHGQSAVSDDGKPIVVLVRRTKGQLSFKFHPDPAPGKDALFELNKLQDKLGPKYPVVAIVEDSAKISDLYQVSGIAGKAGFDNIHTFISNPDNGMMFEVKFGRAIPFSMKGPFDPEPASPIK
ncbi:MAG TPA: hypothetical protein VG033_12225 [Candidatus Acidoferrales bacterium]|nr:hypothetical protein [Candidatus Acidoferrales bacterium]